MFARSCILLALAPLAEAYLLPTQVPRSAAAGRVTMSIGGGDAAKGRRCVNRIESGHAEDSFCTSSCLHPGTEEGEGGTP